MSISSWSSEWKPPISCRAHRRTDIFAPMRCANCARAEGRPPYEQPNTQSNSCGNQRGRCSSNTGSGAPPTAATHGSLYGAISCSSQSGAADASSSMNASTSPLAISAAVLRAEPRWPSYLFATTVSGIDFGGRPQTKCCSLLRNSSSLWSIHRMSSTGGAVCFSTEAMQSSSSDQRSSVYAQIMTETVGALSTHRSLQLEAGRDRRGIAEPGRRASRRVTVPQARGVCLFWAHSTALSSLVSSEDRGGLSKSSRENSRVGLSAAPATAGWGRHRRCSLRIVRSTRRPSRMALRLLAP
jgi:hypothetical protein